MTREKFDGARAGVRKFTGSLEIAAPLPTVAKVLADSSQKTSWLSGLLEERVIEEAGELPGIPKVPAQAVIYQRYHLMWPVNNRDYVIESVWESKPSNDQGIVEEVALRQCSVVDDTLPPDSGMVRADLNSLQYNLRWDAAREVTHVDVEINVDPLGRLPIFFVNIYGSSWCDANLKALADQVARVA